MFKIGCLGIIVILLALYAVFWVKESYIPSWHIEKAREITNAHSVAYKGDDERELLLMGAIRGPRGFLCDTKTMSQFSQETCVVTAKDRKPEEKNKIWIKLSDRKYDNVINLTLDIGEYASYERYSSIAYSDDLFFVVWKRLDKQPDKQAGNLKFSNSINLIIIDRASKEERANKKIFEAGPISINNISVAFDSVNQSLLLAWNDWSYSGRDDLFFGILDIGKFQTGVIDFTNSRILRRDRWEKRYPHFLIDGTNIFLTHSTGDYWTLFSREGRRSIGVSLISQESRPVNYKVIASDFELGRILKIEKGIVFYIQIDSKGRRSEIRTIPFDRAYRPFD